MAVIAIPSNDPWVVARWAFRTLMERASLRLGADDQETIAQAIALDGLHFDLLEADQAKRLAMAIGSACNELYAEFSATDRSESRDAEFAEALAVLEMLLHDVAY